MNKKNPLDKRKSKLKIIFMLALIMLCLFILVGKGVSFTQKKEVNTSLFSFKWLEKKDDSNGN